MIALLGQVMMLAQVAHRLQGMSFGEMAIAVVVLAGICALVIIAVRAFGLSIPPWFVQAMWVLVIVVVIVFAIRFISTM